MHRAPDSATEPAAGPGTAPGSPAATAPASAPAISADAPSSSADATASSANATPASAPTELGPATDGMPDGSASALSAVPAAGSGRGRFAGGAVKFFHGPMDCGKSTLALQLHYNHSRQGRVGMLLTKLDRSGRARISSRIGISSAAVEVGDGQ